MTPEDRRRLLASHAREHAAEQRHPIGRKATAARIAYARRIAYAAAHAPAGGVTVAGKKFRGGEFIPGKVMARATPAEKAKVEGKAAPRGAGPKAPAKPKPKAQARPGPGPEPAGAAPMPAATRITRADVEAAAATPKIAHPTSDEDVARFVDQVKATPVYRAVEAKMAAVAADSPGGNPTLWSLGKHARGDVLGTLKAHSHEAYEHLDWTPERRALHEQILGGMLNPRAKAAPGTRPKVVLLMGPPGSGKTMAGQPEAAKLGVEFTTINADDIKGKLPEYRGWNAGAVHEESALLAEGPLTQRARAARHNILMDLTGGNTAKMEQMAEAMHRDGYDVHVISIALPAYKSTGRAWDRFTQNAFGHADPTGKARELGRFVPPAYVHGGIDGKPEKTYQHLKRQPYVKSYVSISTDVPRGTPPQVVDRGGQS